MCTVELAIAGMMAGASTAMTASAASRANAAAASGADDVISQANAAYASRLIKLGIEGGDQRKKDFARNIATAKARSSIAATFSNVVGTPRNDVQRALINSGNTARQDSLQAGQVSYLRGKEDMSRIFWQQSGAVSGLKTVGSGEQIFGAALSVAKAGAWYVGAGGLEAPSNLPLADASSGSGGVTSGMFERLSEQGGTLTPLPA